MSHFIVSKSSFEIRDVPGMPTTVPERSLYRMAFSGSIPRELNTPPRESLMAITRAFFSAKQPRRERSRVAEPLNRDARAAQRHLLYLARFLDHHHASARRRFLAAF